MNKISKLALLATTCASLAACSVGMEGRMKTARQLASPVWMVERQIPAAPFSLTAYERMHRHHAPAHIYIEGDGLAWLSPTQISMNPTPKNPVALRLAAVDKTDNVAYLARPCQYSGMLDRETPCDSDYWSIKRFAPEVVASFNAALDDIKHRYSISKFHLIGYSGGAGLAAILAAERQDVASLRSVAGNLDHRAHSTHHGISYLSGSIDPTKKADILRGIPQYHFVGEQDKVVPPVVLNSYLQKLGPTDCVNYRIIPDASHDEGWTSQWPELLPLRATCRRPVSP